MAVTRRQLARERYLAENPPPPSREPKPVEERKRARPHRPPTAHKTNWMGKLL